MLFETREAYDRSSPMEYFGNKRVIPYSAPWFTSEALLRDRIVGPFFKR
jgi:hypothetical protein